MRENKPVYITLTAGVVVSYTLFALGLAAHILGLELPMLFTAAAITLLITPTAAVITALATFLAGREYRGALLALTLLAIMALGLFISSMLRQ